MKKFNHLINPQDIVALLAQLKVSEAEYPSSLLAARRADLLKKVANIQAHDGEGPNDVQGQSNSSSTSTTGKSSTVGKSVSGIHTASQTLTGILYAIVGIMTTKIQDTCTCRRRYASTDHFVSYGHANPIRPW
jgi:hypothetical protein